MVGFAGRISLEGDADSARQLLPTAMKLADTLRAWKTTQGIGAVTKAYDLGDGSYCVIADLQNMRAMQIVAAPPMRRVDPELHEYKRPDLDTVGIMDPLSGVVLSPIIEDVTVTRRDNEGNDVELPARAIRNFRPAEYTQSRYDSLTARRRLAVKEDPMYMTQSSFEVTYSIHKAVKPSCFTGAMKKLAQLVLGMGRRAETMWEKKWMEQNRKNPLPKQQVDPETDLPFEVRSPFGLYYTDEVLGESTEDPYAVEFKFDYRFAKTHGITFDTENTPWLVEISTRGVHAMPLYLDPVSLTTQGRRRYLEACPELEEFFDEFGGMPIGYAFPTGEDFAKLKNAGEIVQLLSSEEMQEFYQNSAFGSSIGWSFNSRGSQAHNTCMGFKDNMVTGSHYRVTLRIQPEELPEFSEHKTRLATLLRLTDDWALRKVRRMEDHEARQLADMAERNPNRAAQEFEDFVVEPLVTGQAQLLLVKTGFLFSPGRTAFGPLKFPEPLIEGLISVDMRPFGPVPNPPKQCDTPVFVCHIDDQVEVLYFFRDVRDRNTPPPESTRQECQFQGRWTTTTYGGDPYLAGNLYSTRWDWRQEITPTDTVIEYEGRKAGVNGFAGAAAFFSPCIYVSSSTTFMIRFKSTNNSNRGLRIAAAIPFHDRDCYYMAKHESISAVTKSEGMFYESTPGPMRRLYLLYNWVWHWAWFGCGSERNIDAGRVTCKAKKFGEWIDPSCVDDPIPGNFEYWVCPEFYNRETGWSVYAPLWGNANGNADIVGGWTPGGSVFVNIGGILGTAGWSTTTYPSQWSQTTQEAAPVHKGEVWMISNSGFGPIRTFQKEVTGKIDDRNADYYDLGMTDWWWRPSPDDAGNMPWTAVVPNCLGSNIINYAEQIDGSKLLHQGAPESMRTGLFSCYVGVVR